ncbi:MAG: AP2 domain-containing protein [Terriglobales bacterium]
MKFVPLVPLSSCHVAMVDDADYKRVMAAGPWYLQRVKHTFYAQRYVGRIKPGGRYEGQTLHRFIMGAAGAIQVDHENGIGLDCQRHNLRFATGSQNQGNRARSVKPHTSQYKGVYWDKARGKWLASICCQGRRKNLGRFTREEDAAAAYRAAAREAFGIFVRYKKSRKG